MVLGCCFESFADVDQQSRGRLLQPSTLPVVRERACDMAGERPILGPSRLPVLSLSSLFAQPAWRQMSLAMERSQGRLSEPLARRSSRVGDQRSCATHSTVGRFGKSKVHVRRGGPSGFFMLTSDSRTLGMASSDSGVHSTSCSGSTSSRSGWLPGTHRGSRGLTGLARRCLPAATGHSRHP